MAAAVQDIPRAKVIRAIQALDLDPGEVEQAIIDPYMVRLVLSTRGPDGERTGTNYFTARIVDAPLPDGEEG